MCVGRLFDQDVVWLELQAEAYLVALDALVSVRRAHVSLFRNPYMV